MNDFSTQRDDVFAPSLRRRAASDPYASNDMSVASDTDELFTANPGGVFSPNVQSMPADEAGHYETNRSRSNAPYSPTLLREGEATASPAVAQNPYSARLSELGTQLQSAYAAPHAGMGRQILGALLSRRNPQLAGLVSGETQRERKIEPLQQEYGLLTSIAAQDYARQKSIADIGKSEAEAGKFRSDTALAPHRAALEDAQADAANYKDDPNLGLIDLRTKKPISDVGFAPLTADEARVLGKKEGERVPLKTKNTANEIAMRGITTVNTEEGVYERNRQAETMNRLGSNPRMMFAPGEQYTGVAADPLNPGKITLMKKGQAAAQGVSLPASAESQAAKAVTKSAVAGKISEEINAFNTAIAHADLLTNAAKALGNNDQNTLNQLKNQFANEFGSTGPVTSQVIADAYTREINKMLSSGHITDSEIGQIGKTLNVTRQSLPQTLSALGAYRALAASKMQMRRQQVDRGQKGEANFPAQESNAPPAGAKIRDYSEIK